MRIPSVSVFAPLKGLSKLVSCRVIDLKILITFFCHSHEFWHIHCHRNDFHAFHIWNDCTVGNRNWLRKHIFLFGQKMDWTFSRTFPIVQLQLQRWSLSPSPFQFHLRQFLPPKSNAILYTMVEIPARTFLFTFQRLSRLAEKSWAMLCGNECMLFIFKALPDFSWFLPVVNVSWYFLKPKIGRKRPNWDFL